VLGDDGVVGVMLLLCGRRGRVEDGLGSPGIRQGMRRLPGLGCWMGGRARVRRRVIGRVGTLS